MSRLDWIEGVAKLGIDATKDDDILALVAVARAADKRRRIRMKMAHVTGAEWERLHLHDAAEADIELDAALATLLAEREG